MYRSSWHPAFSAWFQLNVELKSALGQTEPWEKWDTLWPWFLKLQIIFYSGNKCGRSFWSCHVQHLLTARTSSEHAETRYAPIKRLTFGNVSCCNVTVWVWDSRLTLSYDISIKFHWSHLLNASCWAGCSTTGPTRDWKLPTCTNTSQFLSRL